MSKAIQERELSSKYKSYVSQIDKILKMFESTNDWADLIVPLGKLNKVHFKLNKSFQKVNIYFLIV